MSTVPPLSSIAAVRPFVPASDIETSLAFYAELGFAIQRFDAGLALLTAGGCSFLLQHFEAPGFAGNYMMQMLVDDLDAWWKHIESLNLSPRYGDWAPRPPAVQPWGLTVAYIADPSGVLWHLVQKPR